MIVEDPIELLDVAFGAPRGRRCVVLAEVIPREHAVQLTVRDVVTLDDWLRRLRPMGMNRAFADLAVPDAITRVALDAGEEQVPEVVVRRGERGRFRSLQGFDEVDGGGVDHVVDALPRDVAGRDAASGLAIGEDAIPECRELGLAE